MNSHVFIKVSYEFIDQGGFLKKLKDYVGEIRFEAQGIYDRDIVVISFWTDKVEIKEGESRQVMMTCEAIEGTNDWKFIGIEKLLHEKNKAVDKKPGVFNDN